MGSTNLPRRQDLLAVMRLMADVAALKSDPEQQRRVLVDGLTATTGLEQGFAYITDQFRPELKARFVSQTLVRDPEHQMYRYLRELATLYPPDSDPFAYRAIRSTARVESQSYEQVMHFSKGKKLFATAIAYIQSARVRDCAVVYGRPFNGDRLVGVAFHQIGKVPPIRARQVRILEFAVQEMLHLIERGHFQMPPEAGPASLSPRLQQVLDQLLIGRAPKEIARELGLSHWTIREYIQRLYQHFGVNGREALMIRLLGSAGGASGGANATEPSPEQA